VSEPLSEYDVSLRAMNFRIDRNVGTLVVYVVDMSVKRLLRVMSLICLIQGREHGSNYLN
jgi:hypothetical protein